MSIIDGRILRRVNAELPALPPKPQPHRDLPVPADVFDRFIETWNILNIFWCVLRCLSRRQERGSKLTSSSSSSSQQIAQPLALHARRLRRRAQARHDVAALRPPDRDPRLAHQHHRDRQLARARLDDGRALPRRQRRGQGRLGCDARPRGRRRERQRRGRGRRRARRVGRRPRRRHDARRRRRRHPVRGVGAQQARAHRHLVRQAVGPPGQAQVLGRARGLGEAPHRRHLPARRPVLPRQLCAHHAPPVRRAPQAAQARLCRRGRPRRRRGRRGRQARRRGLGCACAQRRRLHLDKRTCARNRTYRRRRRLVPRRLAAHVARARRRRRAEGPRAAVPLAPARGQARHHRVPVHARHGLQGGARLRRRVRRQVDRVEEDEGRRQQGAQVAVRLSLSLSHPHLALALSLARSAADSEPVRRAAPSRRRSPTPRRRASSTRRR